MRRRGPRAAHLKAQHVPLLRKLGDEDVGRPARDDAQGAAPPRQDVCMPHRPFGRLKREAQASDPCPRPAAARGHRITRSARPDCAVNGGNVTFGSCNIYNSTVSNVHTLDG